MVEVFGPEASQAQGRFLASATRNPVRHAHLPTALYHGSADGARAQAVFSMASLRPVAIRVQVSQLRPALPRRAETSAHFQWHSVPRCTTDQQPLQALVRCGGSCALHMHAPQLQRRRSSEAGYSSPRAASGRKASSSLVFCMCRKPPHRVRHQCRHRMIIDIHRVCAVAQREKRRVCGVVFLEEHSAAAIGDSE